MSNIFFIGDTHFRHDNILKFEPVYRPFKTIREHDEWLIARWNGVVKHDDFVWHMGDVVFGDDKASWLDKHMSRLNGRKGLVLGNHDSPALIDAYAKHFTKIAGTWFMPVSKGKKIVLSHAPVHPCQFEHRAVANVHGHMHSKVVKKSGLYGASDQYDDKRYLNVSVEHTKLTPISFDELLTRI
jgi:calcineurin-like phosphoesterase family protein